MTRTRLALMLHFFLVANEASSQILSKALEYEYMAEVVLVLDIILADNSSVEDLLYGALSCSEACLFFRNDCLFCLRLQSVQYDFAWVADEVDCSVALALLQVAFLG